MACHLLQVGGRCNIIKGDKGKSRMVNQPLMVETSGGEKLELSLSSVTPVPVSSQLPLQVIPPTDQVRYPPPVATYDQVMGSPTLFRETLEKLHADMGTKFMIPVIGGQRLDLHRLFLLVTSRGGLMKVLLEKLWKEVHGAFNFKSSATNSSFILRKYYFTLLHHYERVYFLRAEAWSPSDIEFLRYSSFPVKHRGELSVAGSSSTAGKAATERAAASAQAAASPEGIPLSGTIESKFDLGYYITAKLGSETLHGVLYHVPQNPPPDQAASPQSQLPIVSASTSSAAAAEPHDQPLAVSAATASAAAAAKVTRGRRVKKGRRRNPDPNFPKYNISGYNFFFSDENRRLREQCRWGKGQADISKVIGANWRKLRRADRVVYEEKAKKDKARYELQKAQYYERLQAQPLLQLPLHPHSSPDIADLDVEHAQDNVERSPGRAVPRGEAMQVQRPDLNVIDLDDDAEGSSSMDTSHSG